MTEVRSPIMRVDLSDTRTTQHLAAVKKLEDSMYEHGAAYRSIEILMERRDTYTPDLITALLETGEVELWEYQRALPEYPRIGTGFAAACEFLRSQGVEVVEQSASV